MRMMMQMGLILNVSMQATSLMEADSAITFPDETQSAAALDALTKLISDEARRGKIPTGPRAWGMFLFEAISRAPGQ